MNIKIFVKCGYSFLINLYSLKTTCFLKYNCILSVHIYHHRERFIEDKCKCTDTPTNLFFRAILAFNSAKVKSCKDNYILKMPVDKMQLQVDGRSYSKCYYIWPGFRVLAKKLVSFELPSKKVCC